MNVAVNRLTLRGACDAPHHQAFLIEDALNTQLSAESRLVLVRTLSLLPVGSPDHSARDSRFMVADRVANSWTRVMSGACHGGADGACSANTVWFHDAAEAKAILLARLIKGQSVDGWFWKLAVKLWQGQPLAHWIADELLADPPTGQQSGATALLGRLLAERQLEIVEAAILDYVRRSAEPVWTRGFGAASRTEWQMPQAAVSQDTTGPDEPDSEQMPVLAKVAAQLRAALPAGLGAILQRLHSQAATPSALATLAARFVARAAPELQLHPKMLHQIVQQILRGSPLSLTRTDMDLPQTAHSKSKQSRSGPKAEQKNLGPQLPENETDDRKAPLSEMRSEPNPENGLTDVADEPLDNAFSSIIVSERRSAAAGLFFVVNVLRILDWPAWLAARPEHLACNPTAQLLRHIGSRHRVDPRDAAILFLSERIADQEPMDAALLCLWRKAIDRWLLRNARMKLSEMVNRQGWLHWVDDRLDVRFPMQDIDLRLRRLALDRDPGWVDWAGLSMRYHFSDQPLFADGMPGAGVS